MANDPTKFYLGTLGSESPLSANDATLNEFVENIRSDDRLLSGTMVSYKRAQKQHFQWHYTHLAGKRRDVYDGGMSRDDLFALFQADTAMSYLSPNDNAGLTSFTVRFVINSWRQHILQRSGDLRFYDVSFELVEV